jgi:phosphatidate cytidylyltransferase
VSSGLQPTVLWSLGAVFAVLLVATLVVAILKRRRPGAASDELGLRIRSWWVMATVFTLALVLSRKISLAFFAFLSFLALKEYLSLIPTRRADRRVLLWAYLAIPIQYYWIAIGWYGMFIIFIPVYMFLMLPLQMVLVGETRGFLKAVGTLHWGLMVTVFSISHVAFLLALPEGTNPVGGGPALVLFLVVLTEFNDVAQFIWGKALGRRPAVPTVSPNKTVGGFVGGALTTLALALLLAPWLTPFERREALAVGLLLGVGGFIGDVVISAVKRDLRVKDSSALLPGHGGVLDRIDSLMFTAPLFFHYVRYFHLP